MFDETRNAENHVGGVAILLDCVVNLMKEVEVSLVLSQISTILPSMLS